MGLKEEYLSFKRDNRLKPSIFEDRVKLQLFLRDRLEDIWREGPRLSHKGLFTNHMTSFSIGFAYYDCRPTSFCKVLCYGLPLSGVNDFYMFRLAVLTTESLKTNLKQFLIPLHEMVRPLTHLKIGHWGDALVDHVPPVLRLAQDNSHTTFWWYTKKIEVATAANRDAPTNLKAYLSLDPDSEYPPPARYPYGFTYLFQDGYHHPLEREILGDSRLVAVFRVKKCNRNKNGILYPKMCPVKGYSTGDERTTTVCLKCLGKCNFRPLPQKC